MKYKIEVVFGQEQVVKLDNNEKLSLLEKEINLKKYSFESEQEMKGFIDGLNEAVDWNVLDVIS